MKHPTGTKATYNRVMQTHSSDVQMNLNTCAHMLLLKHTHLQTLSHAHRTNTHTLTKPTKKAIPTSQNTCFHQSLCSYCSLWSLRSVPSCRNHRIFPNNPNNVSRYLCITIVPRFRCVIETRERQRKHEPKKKKEKNTNVCSILKRARCHTVKGSAFVKTNYFVI